MNKILYKKMLEAVAQGRDIRQLFTKEEAKQFVIEQVKRKIILAITPFLGKIVVVCLVISVLLALFIVIFQQLAGMWDGITRAWGHLWSGTMSQVGDEDISALYYELLHQGVDFEAIGAVGEHNYIRPGGLFGTRTWLESLIDTPEVRDEVEQILNENGERDLYSLQYWLENVTDADRQPIKVNQAKLDYINSDNPDEKMPDSIVMVEQEDANGNVVYETLEQAATRLLSEQLLKFNGEMADERYSQYRDYPKIDKDEGLGIYLQRYLMAEKETFSIRSDYTFAGEGFKGAIVVDDGAGEAVINPGIQFLSTLSWFVNPASRFTWEIGNLFGAAIDRQNTIERIDDGEEGRMIMHIDTQKSVVNATSLTNKVSIEATSIPYDITSYVKQFAMPWQYPFAFHQHTLSPDVGYEIALMAHKYHELYLQVRPVESGAVKVFNERGTLISNERKTNPQVFLRRISTWYQTTDYDYSKSPHSAWHGVAKDSTNNRAIATNYDTISNVNKDTPTGDNVVATDIILTRIKTDITCTCGECNSSSTSEPIKAEVFTGEYPNVPPESYPYGSHTRQERRTGYYDVVVNGWSTQQSYTYWVDVECPKTITYTEVYELNYVKDCTYTYEDKPVVTIKDTVAKQNGIELNGVDAMTKLLLPDPEIDTVTKSVINYDEAAKYYRANNMKEKELLFISTSAQSIIKSLYDLYDKAKYEYEPTNYDDIEHIVDSGDSSSMLDKSTPKYLSLEGNYQPVVELIQFFAMKGIIDATSVYGLGDANSFAIAAKWFISGEDVAVGSYGNVATIITGSDKEVVSPITGNIYIMEDSDYIYISTEKYGNIYLGNIQLDSNIQNGQYVAQGQRLGVTKGDVSYYRIDDSGQEIENPVQELMQLKTIQFSDYAWPVPDSGNITSRFGSRTDPITGKAARHNGVDIGATQGTPIVSYMAGEIYKAGYDPDGYGNYIIVKHADNCYTLYAHMVTFAKRSGTVEKNEVIGYVGTTGRSTGPHLHFEYRTGTTYNSAIDPMSKLSNYSYY